MFGRRARIATVAGHSIPLVPGGGVAVYEIGGRVIMRVVDGSDSAGIERWEDHLLDGYPDLDPTILGRMVLDLAETITSVERPEPWWSLSEYAAPLLAASPGGHRSHRSWQRATRHVSVAVRRDAVRFSRLHGDLGGGSWLPLDSDHLRAAGFPQAVELPLSADAAAIGAALLELLEQPPIAG